MSSILELRSQGRAAVEASVPDTLWERNREAVSRLVEQVESHRAARHPLAELMQNGEFDHQALRRLALEFHYTFGKGFVGGVLEVMRLAEELEPRLGPRAMVACRFLLQLNLLDELGFGSDPETGILRGDPIDSHYVALRDLLTGLGLAAEDIRQHHPGEAARRMRGLWDESFGDLVGAVMMLALVETMTDRYFDPARKNMSQAGAAEEAERYLGTHMGDAGGVSLDSAHARDLWHVLTQVIPEEVEGLDRRLAEYLDALDGFLTQLAELSSEADQGIYST